MSGGLEKGLEPMMDEKRRIRRCQPDRKGSVTIRHLRTCSSQVGRGVDDAAAATANWRMTKDLPKAAECGIGNAGEVSGHRRGGKLGGV